MDYASLAKINSGLWLRSIKRELSECGLTGSPIPTPVNQPYFYKDKDKYDALPTLDTNMSLYNLIFGYDPRTPLILGMLGLTRDDLGRFIDSHPFQGHFAVIARLNDHKEDYQWVNKKMSEHPLFDGQIENDAETIFLFKKPSRDDYQLPDTFLDHFEDDNAAWSAVEYLKGMRDRPRHKSVTV